MSAANLASTTTGTLEKTPFAHLLVYALGRRLTGTFELTSHDGDWARLTVVEGEVAKVQTGAPVVYLGSLLYELGFITHEELNASLAEMVSKGALHGQVLLARGSIRADALGVALREQTLRKLAYMFGFTAETSFTFHHQTDLLQGYGASDRLTVDPFPAIWRGVCEHPSESHVRAVLDRIGEKRIAFVSVADPARFDFQDDARAAIDELRKRPMSIAELAAIKGCGQRRAQLLAYCLFITKQVEISNAKNEQETRALTPAQGMKVPTQAPSNQPSQSSVPAAGEASPNGRPAHVAQSGTFLSRLSEEHSLRKQRIRDRAKCIQKEDFYQRLGLPRDATPEHGERAFQALRILWDPMTLPPQLAEVRDDCWLVLASMAEAHATIIDPGKNEVYLRTLKCSQPLMRDLHSEDLAASGEPNAFEGAKKCFAKKDNDRAERLVRRAVKEDAKNAEALALLAWLEAVKPNNHTAEATKKRIAMLDRAIELDHRCENAFFWRAQLYKRIEAHQAAMRDFRSAIALNEKNLDAIRELRIYEMRVRKNSISMKKVTPSGGTPRPEVPKPNTKTGGFFAKLAGQAGQK